jgi:hypothetical protein
MIDLRAKPLHAGQIGNTSIPVQVSIARLFNFMAVAASAIAALLPLVIAGYWALVDHETVMRSSGLAADVVQVFGPIQRFGAAVISLLAVAPLSWGLLRLRVCFAEFAQGRPFAAMGIAGLRDFATGIGLSVITKPISFTSLILLLSWSAAPGKRQFTVQLDSDALLLALFAATVASLCWAMEKAATIAEENSQFI